METFEVNEKDYLAHVGVSVLDGAPGPGSGRYPYGSGERPFQNFRDFKNRQRALRAKGVTDQKELANYFGMSIREYRKYVTLANAAIAREDYYKARKMKDHGYSDQQIAEELGRSASSVRDLLAKDASRKQQIIDDTAELLRTSLETQGGYIDVGSSSELLVGVNRSNFDAALKQLESEGYQVVPMSIKQQFGQGNTNYKLLVPAGTTRAEIFNNSDQIRPPVDIHIDPETGEKLSLRPVQSISSKRLQVKYAEEGGIDKDGVIELRRGVSDLDLGNAKYAQVRIGVDGTHFLKGMAVYADDLPDGIDIRFNTNKKQGTPLEEVLKPMKDPDNKLNPFGAAIRPGLQKGAINIVNEEGHWDEWSKTLSSQFLSKQSPALAKKQLQLASDISKDEFEEIKSLTNPTVKRFLLKKFADGCDADAVHLKAASLPRQANKVILPLTSLKDNEVYAPTFDNGEKIALVRHPHGGIFEIPILTVNNNNKEGKKVLGNARDAIGIKASAAGILSGADFDGDTVVAIPLKSAKIKNLSPDALDKDPVLKSTLGTLRTFDTKTYQNKDLPASRLMSEKSKGNNMGKITNLITDMTIQGATPDELTRAVKYSMVVIDAPKHKLDYKQAEKDFNIKELTKKYRQGGGTIVSQAKSPVFVPETKEVYSRNTMTPSEKKRYDAGEIITRPTGKTKYNGDLVTQKSNKMRETKDPYTLTSGGSKENPGTVIEKYYADYASTMKSLANEARAELRRTPRAEKSSSAAKTYAAEVTSLNASLEIAKSNEPKERQAQALANNTVRIAKANHPEWDKDDEKKCKSDALNDARAATGAGKIKIEISDKEWEAIQAGAISDTAVQKILDNTDIAKVRELSMPRDSTNGMSAAKISRAESMLDRGYTWKEVASQMGVTVDKLKYAIDNQ